MEEVVPGASVVPTLLRLGATQTENVGGVTEFTVSVAVLLVAVPAVLLTSTRNVEPLSDVVVAGVV